MAARLNSAWLQGHSAVPSDCDRGILGCIFQGKSVSYGLENIVVLILAMLLLNNQLKPLHIPTATNKQPYCLRAF
jgi:hypothetical protein